MSEVIEVYGLRWQIELFFKEIKSSLGFSQYRFRSFEKIESWASLCLAAFSYLEWTRAEKLRHRKKNKENRIWWQNQRTHGMAMAVRQKAEEREIDLISRALDSKTGIKRIKKTRQQGVSKRVSGKAVIPENSEKAQLQSSRCRLVCLNEPVLRITCVARNLNVPCTCFMTCPSLLQSIKIVRFSLAATPT
jgi:hypothetical protein